MCGIFGVVERESGGSADLQASARRMADALAHRGPDDWGTVTLENQVVAERALGRPDTLRPRSHATPSLPTVIVGHHRLSIVDLSHGGHQPMTTADGALWLTFNGEIYNHRELRAELQQHGVTFKSSSDTEVLLQLYAREGTACLDRLRGMFAFAVWDERDRSLLLARDRFGIKPLYYTVAGSRLTFASELQALARFGGRSFQIDPEAEISFLRQGSIAAPRTWYRDASALQPGRWLKWSGGIPTERRYWSASQALETGPAGIRTTSQVAPIVRDALVDSVRAHIVSDVPVGLFLSGGLDSAALLGAMRALESGPIRTFTVRFPGFALDESDAAERTARHFDTEHQSLDVTDETLASGLDAFFDAMDQPTVDGLNMYLVARFARDAGMKVVLSGVGGDECLGGYPSFLQVPSLARRLRVAGLLRSTGLPLATAALVEHAPAAWAPKAGQLLRESSADLQQVWRNYRSLFTSSEIERLKGERSSQSQPNARAGDRGRGPAFWQIVRYEIEQFMTPQLLRDADVFTMRHGLELRTPFVDHEFLSAVRRAGAWRLDGAPTYKISLFRHLTELLPPQHPASSKLGFTLPIDSWLKRSLAGPETRFGQELRSRLDRTEYQPFVNRFLRGQLHWSRIWALYVLERTRDTSRTQWTSQSSSSTTTPQLTSRAV